MMKEDLQILRMLRNDARIKMADVARCLNLPKTTVNDKYRRMKNNMIVKHATLIDFRKLGNPLRVNIAIEAKKKEELLGFLMQHSNVNSVSTVHSHDFYIDAIFSSMAQMNDFMEELGSFRVTRKNVHHIIEDIKTEDFLTREKHLRMV
jgi:DNA-binding Lrp family transcriptional regulator